MSARKQILLALLFVGFMTGLIQLSQPAMAAPKKVGWISSGGEVFLFDRNPWFLKNVTTVRYCLVIDANSVSLPPADVKAAFLSALQYWQTELKGDFSHPIPGIAAVATQNWLESACDENTDIAIKVGHGALDSDEIAFLTRSEGENSAGKRVESYIGVSIRKSYDLAEMRAKGTLFIASDRGAHAYENKGQLIVEAWKNKALLEYAFMHELGHVFGIPHTGMGMMSEVFLEQALSTRMASFYIQNPQQSFLNPPLNFEVCSLSGTFQPQFFKIATDASCLVLRKDTQNANGIRWIVLTRQYATSQPQEIGDITLERASAKKMNSKPVITIQLPEEQKVFGSTDRGFASFLISGLTSESDYEGAFHLKGSLKPYPLIASLRTDGVTLWAVVDNKPQPVLVYAPPTLIKMLIGM